MSHGCERGSLWRGSALGGLFVAGSYFSFTLFDALAMRYIGAELPYRRVALASFSALSERDGHGQFVSLGAERPPTPKEPRG